jgi:hypothetical protein
MLQSRLVSVRNLAPVYGAITTYTSQIRIMRTHTARVPSMKHRKTSGTNTKTRKWRIGYTTLARIVGTWSQADHAFGLRSCMYKFKSLATTPIETGLPRPGEREPFSIWQIGFGIIKMNCGKDCLSSFRACLFWIVR